MKDDLIYMPLRCLYLAKDNCILSINFLALHREKGNCPVLGALGNKNYFARIVFVVVRVVCPLLTDVRTWILPLLVRRT